MTTMFCGDIILRRRADGTPEVNIPRRIVVHSPSGFEWGYGGSGPADLALNIISLFVHRKDADALYQAFKWEFIAPLKWEGGVIPSAAIQDWIRRTQK